MPWCSHCHLWVRNMGYRNKTNWAPSRDCSENIGLDKIWKERGITRKHNSNCNRLYTLLRKCPSRESRAGKWTLNSCLQHIHFLWSKLGCYFNMKSNQAEVSLWNSSDHKQNDICANTYLFIFYIFSNPSIFWEGLVNVGQ